MELLRAADLLAMIARHRLVRVRFDADGSAVCWCVCSRDPFIVFQARGLFIAWRRHQAPSTPPARPAVVLKFTGREAC